MEKLYKVVCANFALSSKKPLKCNSILEDGIDDALLVLVGIGCNIFGIGYVAMKMKTSHAEVEELQRKFSKKKSRRFGIKTELVLNGMKL